jgi:hypothetical protein
MSTLFKGITLHEGYNDIGTFEVNITSVENPSRISSYVPVMPKDSRKLLFQFLLDTGGPIREDYVVNCTVHGRDASEDAEYTAKPDSGGYIQIDTPVLPVVTVPTPLGTDALLRLELRGPLDERAEECYMEVTYDSDTYYTLIRDLFIDPVSGKLAVLSASDNYYVLATDITVDVVSITAVHVTAKGVVYGYDSSLGEWGVLGTLEFTMIEFPDKLTVSEDGFYFTNAYTGTLTPFEAGDTGYEDYHVEVLNPGIYLVDVDVEVSVEPDGVVYSGPYTNLMPGDLNFTIIPVPGPAPVAPDESPTIEEIATLAGITFSEKFLDFLEDKELATLEDIRKAGPIEYIAGFDPADITNSNLKTLQGHVSFYAINKNAVQNQRMISQGFKNIAVIAFVPRKTFMDAVVNGDLPFFQAAKIHELAVQNQKFTDNMIAGTLSDLRLASPATPAVEGSNFVSTVLGKALNSCGCDDCKSMISPFSYLFDLLKYGAAHVKHTTSPTYDPGTNLGDFITLMANTFLQPFDSMAIDCKTLHDEFCRVRLVTEVLEKKVLTITAPASLANERSQFFQLVYQSILLQAGTSMNEVRTVYLTKEPDKLAAAQKLSDKLGIPLYVPLSADYTVDELWLTLSETGAHELNAIHLETIFGFRDTTRSVTTDPPISDMEVWQGDYLRDFWHTQDYVYTNYSREGAVPGSTGTYKSNWLPIIDPDIMGWEDMTYLGSGANDPDEADVKVAIAAKELWLNRKAQTDEFLKDCAENDTLSLTISADFASRIVQVKGEDIVGDVIEDDLIYLQPTSDPDPDERVSFLVDKRVLDNTNTNVSLAQSSTAVFNPYVPKMWYNRELTVASSEQVTLPSTALPFFLSWLTPVFQNATGVAKLISTTSVIVYSTDTSDITFTVDSNDLKVTIDFLVTADPTWLLGAITLVYEVEVDLYSTTLVDPVLLTKDLFLVDYSYDPLPAAVIDDPTDYRVWDKPGSWTGVADNDLYAKMKELYSAVSSGLATEEQLEIVSDNLHISIPAFNRLMVLLGISEKYLASMFTAPRPTMAELYEMASIIYTSAKTQLRGPWVEEEIEYVKDTDPINLQLSGQYFWKSLNEPASGTWDPSLQTIPSALVDVDEAIHRPIVDPLFVSRDRLLANPEAKQYRDLYDARKDFLDSKYDLLFALVNPYVYENFDRMLNYVNTNDEDTPYTIPDYASFEEAITDLNSMDVFTQKNAADALYEAFGINAADILQVAAIREAYLGSDATKVPVPSVLAKAVRLLLPGYARLQKYFGADNWIDEEIEGDFDGGDNEMVWYYNVLHMSMAPGRGDADHRREWQATLAAWNRLPFIQPDIVPPENIKDFSASNTIYDIWNARHTALVGEYSDIEGSLFPGEDADVLLLELSNRINTVISRSATWFTVPDPDPDPHWTYLPYFLQIEDIEKSGEDIRPNLALLGIKPAEYRFLWNIYKLLESEGSSPSSITASECDDTINILIAIRSRNRTFNQVQEEFDEDIILDQDYFLNYQPPLVSFPQMDLPVYNQWRSPQADRKAWKDLLESRIEQEQGVTDRWKEVLKEAEDRNMPLMRDALIRALTADCQLWQDKAEELAKTYFMETKDNCCVKHTRVSFAIETMQGFLNALNTGVYDGFIGDFILNAPAFRREWEWLGSYATWRAAIFVYIYPENLLYPTLKKLQSPAFIKLADTVQNANRFSPANACQAAQEFQAYLEDIKSLDICCTANSYARVSVKNPTDCCIGEADGETEMTYYFGKGKSGTTYWSRKAVNDNSKNAHSFWEELPVRKTAKLISCFVYSKRLQGGTPEFVWLMLFYSYIDKDKFKIAYIKKDIYDENSGWSEETETDDLPSITDNDHISLVTGSQSRQDEEYPSFLLSYTVTGQSYKAHSIRHYQPNTDKWIEPISTITVLTGPPMAQNSVQDTKIYSLQTDVETPVASIRMPIYTQGFPPLDGYVYVFEKKIIVQGYGPFTRSNDEVFPGFYKIRGAFQSAEEVSTFIVFHEDAGGTSLYTKIKTKSTGFSGSSLAIQQIRCDGFTLTGTGINNITKPYPVFSMLESYPRQLAFATKGGVTLLGATASNPGGGSSLTVLGHFALAPERLTNTAVQSAECITDMLMRAAKIKDELQANTNAPEGTSVNAILRTNAVREVLYEAYYFVPMLLALDQQKRGEYQAALDWYSSVYDFRNANDSARKIFYGLVLEESIVNTYSHTPNWLLDPLNPHLIAQSRAYAYAQYTIINIVQCLFAFADREFTMDTIETVPLARRMYTEALELLKVKELNREPNGCELAANACLESQVDLSAAPGWQNMFGKLKEKLRKLGTVSLIQTVENEVAEMFEGATEATYPGSFADAFDIIDSVVPAPPATQTVSERMTTAIANGIATGNYLLALDDRRAYNERVEADFAQTVAGLSGLKADEVAEPGWEDRIAWLAEALPDNLDLGYEFSFQTDGAQHLTGDDRYNPLSPTRQAYEANLLYSNANAAFYRGAKGRPKEHMPWMDIGFCMPKNPVYDSLQLKGNVELYKIFNCRNIAGMVRELDPYAAATDSVTGMPFIGASGNLVTPGIGNYFPVQYRFRTLIERAKQLVGQAQQMESLFLAALEKLDNENYSQLRARQDLQTAKATVKLQDLRITQAVDEQGVAQIQLDKATFTQAHYDELISAGINALEQATFALMQFSAASSGLAAVADFYTFEYGRGFSSLASALSAQSSALGQLASYERRAEEWNFQKDLAGFDIQLANQQIKVSEDNIRIVTQERDIAQMNTDHAADSLEFLKTKFTNAELYNFMSNVLERSYSYMLNLATSTAKTAERQLYFERQEQAGPFVLNDYWEAPTTGGAGGSTDRRGLTGSARLTVDVTRLDQFAFETNKRKLQMTKVISLAQNFPSEFQQFKETGVINFALTNKLFDYDFPGHYLRLINSVKTTVIALVPVYDNIKATLTAGSISYTVIGGTTFQRVPIRRTEIDSVALTSASNATGVFEMQPMQNELLNPFENMGIESQWEFKMPKFSNRMDYSNIADVLLTVEYTAFDSFLYRTQVLQDLDNSQTFNRGFSFKNDFPDQWYELADVEDTGANTQFTVNIELKREMFPQGIVDLKMNAATGVVLYFVRADGYTQEIEVADFNIVGASAPGSSGDTINGMMRGSTAMNSSLSPLLKLKLSFDNKPTNRELFSLGYVTDILVLVGCKADLPAYPL